MNILVVCLVFLLVVETSVCEFTAFENGVVTGVIQHKDSKKCINFGTVNGPRGTCQASARGPFRWCHDHLAKLVTSNCATVTLDTNGLIRVSGWCLHWFQSRDVFKSPCGRWPGDWNHFENLIYVSVQPNGEILLNNGQNCITKHSGYDPKLRALSNSDATCQASSSRFRLVATGMSWFARDSSSQPATSVDTSADHCDFSNRRLCTAAEVCPSSPGEQSVAGVTGESSNKALLVVGDAFLDAATCQRLSQTSGYTVDGFLCCPDGPNDLPTPKDFVSDGYGYLMHKSGKCAHYTNQGLVLKTDCKGQTALMSWSSDGRIKQGTNCIVAQSLGQCPPFQFTNVNSLQDVFTGKCLVPEVGGLNPDDDTRLVERAGCGEAYSSFALKRIQGYLKHSSNKCVGVNASKLVFKATCTSAEQVFYKEKFSSRLIHVASGRCVGDPDPLSTAMTLTDCTSDGAATLTYDGKTLGYSGDKCVKPKGGGDSPADDEELVIQTGCSGAASTFHFADAIFCGDEPCTCVQGYEKHGENCFPINNCENSNGGCLGEAECVYTGPGTSMCICPPGYQLNSDGTNCNQCPDNNCYTQCQFVDDDELKSVTSLQTHVEVRFLNVKTSDLLPYVGETTTELVVYAHQITISGTLTLPTGVEKVAFFANEIVKENGAEIILWNNAQHVTVSTGRRAVVKVENNKLLCQNRYSASNPWPGHVKGTVFNIYTSKTSSPFSCSGNYNTIDISIQAAIKSKRNPKKSLDAELYSIMLNCAKVLAQGATFAKENKLLKGGLPVALIQHVLNEIRAAKEEQQDTGSVNTIRLNAKNLMEDLSLRARGYYRVPYLSLKAHEKILILIKDDAKIAIQKYERFERISQDFAAGIEATDSMTELMTTIVRKNDLDVAALETELEAAKSDCQAMKDKLDDAKTALEAAKATFEAGVRAYSNQQIANAVFSVLGGITTIFAGGAGAVMGFTIELSSLADDISRIQKTLFKISIIMDSVSKITEAANAFTDLHYDVLPYAGTEVSDYYSKSMPEKNDQSLAVMVKEWDVFAAEADAFLGVGTASGISGASDYLAALKTVAIWGKGYHEKSITVQELLSTLTKLKTLKNEQHEAQVKIKTSRDNALTLRKVNGELLIEMALQKQRLRNIMVEKLMSFCDSYFYNWLSECPVMPTMSDDLYALHEKVNQGLSAVINAVENFAPFIPQEFKATIVLTDDPSACNGPGKRSMIGRKRQQNERRSGGGGNQLALNTLKCPISELKRAKSFLFKLDENDPDIFEGHERVHVDEIEIYFDGVQFGPSVTKKTITAWISFTGMMTDVFRGARYEFLAPPRITEFSYKIKPDNTYEVMQSGKVSSKYQEYYDGIAALTTWSVSLPAALNNPSLNLQGVSQVKLKLKGTRVPVQPVSHGDKDSGQDQRVAKKDKARRQKRKGKIEKRVKKRIVVRQQ